MNWQQKFLKAFTKNPGWYSVKVLVDCALVTEAAARLVMPLAGHERRRPRRD